MSIMYLGLTSLLLFLALHTSNSQTNRFRDLSIKDVHFTIHTRRNPYGISITTDNVNHVSKVETVLLIAGWNQDTLSNSSYFRNFTYIYLKEKNINVIQTHADHVLTYYNLDYVYQIGKIVGNLLVKLDSENKVNLTQMHLIGVGVGSHIAGIAADYASSTIPKRKVDRISALSPTYTSFLNGGGFIRQLQASDARYVDIYVTSISGTQEPTGNGTFYPNGGETQPLCPVCGKDSDHCNEMRSAWLFMYTIGMEIPSYECDSYTNFLSNNCKSTGKAWFGDSNRGNLKGKLYLWLHCWAHKQCKYQY